MSLSQMIVFIVESLNSGASLRDELWQRQLKKMEDLVAKGTALGGDVSVAANFFAAIVMERPSEIDRDARFYFLTSFLNSKLSEVLENDPALLNTLPVSPPRDFFQAAIMTKDLQLRDFVAEGHTAPPAAWKPEAVYSPRPTAFPSQIDMMLCNFNVYRHLGHGDAGDRQDDILRIHAFLTDPRFRGQPGCLSRDEKLMAPVDMAWAFAPSVRRSLRETQDANPDRIWSEYRP